MKIKRTAHGRSVVKEIIPEGVKIEDLINQLNNKGWNESKLSKAAKKTFMDIKLEIIIDSIRFKNTEEIIPLLQKHILELYDDQVGKCFAGIYLVGYVKMNDSECDLYNAIKERFAKEGIVYHATQIKKIIRYAIMNGKYLKLLNNDGTVSNKKFFLNWGYYQEDFVMKNTILTIRNTLEEDAEIRWYYEMYNNRHALVNQIKNAKDFNFSAPIVIHKKIKKDGKVRKVHMVQKTSKEYVVMKYLKQKLDVEYRIQYSNRDSITRELFALISNIDNLTIYTIFRFDIKDFFDSVETKFIWDNYLEKSNLDQCNKILLKQIIESNFKCHAGIPISNVFVEIAGKYFDNSIQAELKSYGLIFYSRFVDDGLIILNRKVKENDIHNIVSECVKKYFGSDVELHDEKYNYLTKLDTDEEFDYLGYLFKRENGKFLYGITEEKRKKYQKIIDKIIDEYLIDRNRELLRQRIIYFISRVVFYNKYSLGPILGSWDVIGFSANYCLLREPIVKDRIERNTCIFLKNAIYTTLMRKTRGEKFYFINNNSKENYSMWNSIKRNKSIVFHAKIGWSIEYLCKQIRKLGYMGKLTGKSYRECVAIYYSLMKLPE